jgi:hypothetical protein
MKKLFALLLFCNACLAGSEPTPTPSPTPVISRQKEQWLTLGTTDPTQPAGTNPKTTFFVTKYEIEVRPFGDGFLCTFKPRFEP